VSICVVGLDSGRRLSRSPEVGIVHNRNRRLPVARSGAAGDGTVSCMLFKPLT